MGSHKSFAPEFVYLESKKYREVDELGSSGDASGWKQVRVSTLALDTDACQHKMIRIRKENSSGSLPPVVSMMQARRVKIFGRAANDCNGASCLGGRQRRVRSLTECQRSRMLRILTTHLEEHEAPVSAMAFVASDPCRLDQ